MKQSEFVSDKERIAASMASGMYIHILEKLIGKVQEILDEDYLDVNKVIMIRDLINPYIEIRNRKDSE